MPITIEVDFFGTIMDPSVSVTPAAAVSKSAKIWRCPAATGQPTSPGLNGTVVFSRPASAFRSTRWHIAVPNRSTAAAPRASRATLKAGSSAQPVKELGGEHRKEVSHRQGQGRQAERQPEETLHGALFADEPDALLHAAQDA